MSAHLSDERLRLILEQTTGAREGRYPATLTTSGSLTGHAVESLAREVQEHRTMVERLKALHRDDEERHGCDDGWPCTTIAILDGEKT